MKVRWSAHQHDAGGARQVVDRADICHRVQRGDSHDVRRAQRDDLRAAAASTESASVRSHAVSCSTDMPQINWTDTLLNSTLVTQALAEARQLALCRKS